MFYVALVLGVAYAVLREGGIYSSDWNIVLLALALATIFSRASVSESFRSSSLERTVLGAALLFPTYVVLQIVPLPVSTLNIISPARAELTTALVHVTRQAHFAPLSIAPSITVVHLSRIVGYLLVFLLAREMALRSRKNLWVSAVPLIIIGGLEAAWGIGQYWTTGQNVSGTLPDRDLFAGLLEMILPLNLMYGIAVLYRGRERGIIIGPIVIKALGVWLVSVEIFVAVVLSSSKMGFVSTLGTLLVVLILGVGCKISGWRKWPVLVGFGVFAVLAFVFVPPNELIQQFGTAASDPTAEGRWPIWKDTLHLIAAYPVFGCGLGNYNPGLLRYETAGLNVGWAWAHNDYLQLLAELGIIGFLIPATLILAALVKAANATFSGNTREARLLGLGCAGSITAILIHCTTEFHMYIPANAMVLSWISGVAVALPDSDKCPPKRSVAAAAPLRRLIFILGCSVTLYASAWLVFFQVFPIHPQVERMFCRFGICDTDGVLRSLQGVSGHSGIGGTPRADFIEFVSRDPAGPARWCDLGESFRSAGEIKSARSCFSRALVLGPHLPYILFRVANFYLSVGENRKALPLMDEALQGDSGYDQIVFNKYQQRRIPINEILQSGLSNRHSYQTFLRFLINGKRGADTEKVWGAIVSHGYSDDKLANEYVAFLIQNGEPETASQAWTQYAGKRDKGYPDCNRVFNGSFESEPTGSRFDWTIEQTPGANIDLDHTITHSGSRSLQIQFDGTQNLSSMGVRQTVFLKPGRYRFQAYVRAKEISTDEGIAFRVANEQTPNQFSFTTEPMLGSADWKLVQHSFVVPPSAAGLVEVRLVRTPSLRFDNLIRGKLWIDQVSISPEPLK